ncbi:MAG: type IV pilin [Haloferacaceae archaeon]
MEPSPVADERAVSPVVAVSLLIAISVLLAFAIGSVVLDQDLGTAEAPSVTLSFEVEADSVVLKHEGGDPLDADTIVVLDQDGSSLAGLQNDLIAGESEPIATGLDDIEEITVVWEDPDSDTTEILATFEL